MHKVRNHKDKFKNPNRWELFKYIYFTVKPSQGLIVAASLIFLILSISRFLLKPKISGPLDELSLFLVFTATISVMYSTWSLSRYVYKKENINIESHPKAIKMLSGIKGAESVPGSSIESIMYDMSLNRWLQSSPKIKLVLNNKLYERVLRRIKANADIVEKLIRVNFQKSLENNKQFNNDKKICIAQDIIEGMDECSFYRGRYFDSFVTNEYCTKIVSTVEARPQKISSGLDMFPIRNSELLPIHLSGMNNHVGISTLAITNDGYIQLWKQGSSTQVSEGKVVATGSGSLDACDLDGSSDLINTIINGMNRELLEESSKQGRQFKTNPIKETRVTGYFRWIKRGGKPEFVGISKLTASLIELEPNVSEVEAPDYSELEIKVGKTWVDLKHNLDYSMNEFAHYSPSCWMALMSLRDIVNQESEEWEHFIFK